MTARQIPIFYLLLLCFAISTQNVLGQNQNPNAILNSYFEAISTKDSILNIKSLKTRYQAKTEKYTITLSSELVYPNLKNIEARVDTTLISRFIFDGETALSYSTIGKETYTDSEVLELKEQSSPFIELNLQGTAIYKGRTTYNGVDVHQIQLTEYTVAFYELNTGLKIGTKTLKRINDEMVPQEIQYLNYRSFRGVKLPRKMIIIARGRQMEYTLEYVEIN